MGIGRILLVQLCLGGALVAPLWVWLGKPAALSWLLGSLTCVVPGAFVAALLLVRWRDARAALRAAYWGEAGKLVLTVVMFATVFARVHPLHPGLLFAGFIATYGVSLFALLWDTGKKT